MPKSEYTIIHPDGREITVEGERPPTQADALKIFATLPPKEVVRAPYEKVAVGDGVFKNREPVSEDDPNFRLNLALRGGSRDGYAEPRGNGALADIAMEGGGAAAGQSLGALTGPFAPVAVPVLGAVGGALGDYAGQRRRIAAGEQTEVRPGEVLSSAITSAIPGGPLSAVGRRAVIREAGKQTAGALTGKTVETLVDEGRGMNPTEAVLTTVLPAVGGAVAQRIQAANPAIRTAVADAEAGAGALRRETFEAAREAGYVVPPSTVNPSFVNKRLESVAGKAAVGQEAAIRNQEVTNRLAREALGLPENTDITMGALQNVRRESAAPYEEIARLSPVTADQLQALRRARQEANVYGRHYDVSADPDSLERARLARELAETLETNIEAAASTVGGGLMDRLRAARTRIARSYDVERALNLSNGEISAPIIGRAMDKGRPLTEELETIGRFAEAFPSVAREGSRIPTPGVSKVEAGLAAMLGVAGVGATQSPYGALAGMLPLASGATRSAVLSRPGQALLAEIPAPVIDATPDKIAAAIRLLSQAAGGNEQAAKLFQAPGSLLPKPASTP